MVAKMMEQLSFRNSKRKMDNKKCKFKEDRISQLPDEVLGSILSRLTIREAARTSVLCHRWDSLWTLFNGSLKFDFTASPFTGRSQYREHERTKYLNWVNQVLTSLSGSSLSNIDEFIVHHCSDKESRCHIDRWVLFALERRTQRLELAMMPFECDNHEFIHYTLPHEFFTYLKPPRDLNNVSPLTSLCLKHVNVSGELIVYILSNCSLLEHLCVWDSDQLTSLKVASDVADTLLLKYFEISYCFNLSCLEICATNLVSFKYCGSKINFRIENNPKLVEVSIGREDVINLVVSFSSYFSQIETLKLLVDMEIDKKFTPHLRFTKLKDLTLEVFNRNDESLLGWTSLITSSPLLHKLTLEMITIQPRFGRRVQKMTGGSSNHECLKVVELVGFVGGTADLEVVNYLLASCSALEKIIVNCRHPYSAGLRLKAKARMSDKQAKCRRRALRLKRKVLSHVELVVI